MSEQSRHIEAPAPSGTADRDGPVRSGKPGRIALSRRTRWLVGAALLVGALGLIGYTVRTQMAERVITRQLADANVDASYRIERIGLTHQRLTDVRIGDPARPDLLAREVDIWIGYGWDGPRVDRLRLRGVRLQGRYDGTRLRLGQLDRLLPSPTDEPLALPDLGLDIADATIRIETPWGIVDADALINGNPLRAMTGQVAARSDRLRAADCTFSAVSGRAVLRSDGVDVALAGPVSAAQARCAGSNGQAISVQGTGLRTNAQAILPVGLASLRWRADFAAAALAGGGVAVSGLAGRSTGRWSLAESRGSGFVTARANGLAGSGLTARGAALRGDFAHAEGRWRFSGGTALTGATVPPAWRGLGGQLVAQRDAPLLGPLLAEAGAAFDAATRSFRLTAPLRLDGSSDRMRLTIPSARLRSASGVDLVMTSSEQVLGWDGRRVALGGEFRLSGGGLPTLSGTLRRGQDGSVGVRVMPFRAAASGAALAVDRFELAMDADGNGRFVAAAGASGPLAGGRIDGLALPLTGRIAGGRVSIDPGCRDLSFAGLAIAGARFGAAAVRVCSLPGEPLLAIGDGPVHGGIVSGPLTLNGRSGATPLSITADALRYTLADGAADISGLSVRFGEGARVTSFAAEALTARAAAGGWRGELRGGAGRIGAVPFEMSAIAGPWRWEDGALTLEGAVAVADAVVPERFTPMTIEDATLTYADNRITARGTIRNPASAVPLANLTLAHRFASASGEAEFILVPIRFSPDGLQPQALSALALGVVANVEATVTGDGRIAWTPDGVSSTGRFATENAELAAAFGPVSGLSGTIEFDDLLAPTTPPGQVARVASINPGIEVTDGTISYQMLLNNRVRIEGGQWPFAGGTLRLLPGLIDYAADQPRYLSFDVEGIDAARFLERYGFENITATGLFDGVIPTIFDGNGGRVTGGSLVVRDGGGSLAYVGELSTRDLGYFGNIAFGALRSVEYDALVIRLNGNIDGEMLTEVSFTGLGQGPGVRNNFLTRQIARLPFAFNIRINAPFRQLLTSARSLYDPTVLIDQNLPDLVRAEAAERARQVRERDEPPVQQQDSADVPEGRKE